MVDHEGSGEQPAPTDSTILFRRYAEGDERAADEIFERFAPRLTRLAHVRMSDRLRTRIDADDVVMSACRSFFLAARAGRFTIERGGDLWRLLVRLTLHKLYRQAARHGAARRSVQREQPDIGAAIESRAPTPDVAAELADELSRLMRELSPLARQVLELRLSGHRLDEIAKQVRRHERTVRRLLDQARDVATRLHPEFKAATAPAGRRVSLTRRVSAAPGPAEVGAAFDERPGGEQTPRMSLDELLITRQIGEGAVGKVYRAVRLADGESVAVKFLRRRLANRPEWVRRFLHEATMMGRLNHPGIVRLLGIGPSTRDGWFLALELAAGGDLAQRASRGPVPVGDAIRWVAQAAAAVEHIHSHGLCHWDLKPSNVLLHDECARVSDFGLAGLEQDGDGAPLVGTPAFLAPEQWSTRHGAPGARTDLFGLGAVLYFLLTGAPPHRGDDLSSVLKEVDSGEPIRIPASLRGGLPTALVSLVESCLERSPTSRPATAHEVAQELARLA